jgi:hypothetical protein
MSTILSDAQIAVTRRMVDEELAFRARNPQCGRVTYWSPCNGLAGNPGRPTDEVAYVAFERIGMNTIERGKTTFIRAPDGRIKHGPCTDYTTEAIPGREAYSMATPWRERTARTPPD